MLKMKKTLKYDRIQITLKSKCVCEGKGLGMISNSSTWITGEEQKKQGVSADEGESHVGPWCSLSPALRNRVFFVLQLIFSLFKYTGFLWIRSHYCSVVDVNSLVKGGRIRKYAKYNKFSINYTFKSRKRPMFRWNFYKVFHTNNLKL